MGDSYVRHDRTNVGRYLTKEKPMSRATTQNHASDVERAPVGAHAIEVKISNVA